ncbi:GNAT family N-acetyltransferase [Jeotgalibaca sp. MA1X17-3]|uniref:GNAT family N-acetyltransferase n=1 Tax=Jeotgalibaca sp. MA1X17-3 TaxID=2908211 RepID=UPI001F169D4C|nr:GNAT family N-acetyltransferase [Jeotgalibaca sp. MA1X17-3]UJF15151.1 GNAT family N-acetyltransferase [Jeotgalibaca sp. MA1X17-3]
MLTFDYTLDTNSPIYKDSLQIRRTVFISEQHVDPAIEIDEKESLCIHLVAYNPLKKAVATARLYPVSSTILKIQRVAVLREERKKRYGEELMQQIELIAREKEYTTLILGAQNHALPFYERLGYSIIGEEYEEAGILHHDMEKIC